MLHIVDNLPHASALQDLRDLCDIHGRLKEEHDGDAQFSWRPETGSPRSIHAAAQQAVVDQLYGEFAPADLTACIVLKVGEFTVPVPLGAHEAEKWDRVCDAIDNAISALDDEASDQ